MNGERVGPRRDINRVIEDERRGRDTRKKSVLAERRKFQRNLRLSVTKSDDTSVVDLGLDESSVL